MPGIKFSEVVLEAKDSENGVWEYYIVDHESQHLFWLGKHQLQTGIYKGAESAAHIGTRVFLSSSYQSFNPL